MVWGDIYMDKNEYEKTDILEQIIYINKLLLEGNSMRTISASFTYGKSTIARNFNKSGYVYDSNVKQFIINDVANVNGNVSSDINGNIASIKKETTKNVKNNSIIKDKINDKVNDNSIVINRPVNVIKPKRASYYLNIKTIKQIEDLADSSGMGISQFLQKLLDATLDKIKIE